MEKWFTVEKIDDITYAISEYKHWEETHCYLLLGKCRALLIDTGLGVQNIRNVVQGITSLPVTVIATHVHWDHIGGHKEFNNILVSKDEEEWLSGKFPIPLTIVKKNSISKKCNFPSDFNIADYKIYENGASGVVSYNDIIDLGNRSLKVIHTPGHSPGHICLYEEKRQYLFSGDLVYAGCLDAFYPTTDPQLFLKSVKRIKTLPIQRILPAHHSLDISPSLIEEVYSGFEQLSDKGILYQGAGIFNFGSFKIHI